MAKRRFLAGVTSQSIDVFIEDSSSGIGAGLTGLVYNTAGLTAYYRKNATGSATSITLVTLATIGTAWASGGFKEVDATNMPGVYRVDVPDTVLAAAGYAVLVLRGAANMPPVVVELEIYAPTTRVLKNTALSAFMFFMADSTDHISPKTGLTVTGTVSKNGGAFGALTNSITEIANGWYKVDLAAGDLNADTVALKFTGTGADQQNIGLITQTE